jgi:hypothetical protein
LIKTENFRNEGETNATFWEDIRGDPLSGPHNSKSFWLLKPGFSGTVTVVVWV